MPSTVLGNGSKSGDECIAPFSVPHFRWHCLLDGPNTEFSIPVDALIDNGSHLVLIDDALVKKLGVGVHPLKETIDVSMAMSAGGQEKMSLSQYVQLSCVSEDLSRINRFSLSSNEGCKRGVMVLEGAGVLARGTRSCT